MMFHSALLHSLLVDNCWHVHFLLDNVRHRHV
jgi:hypothetical protein